MSFLALDCPLFRAFHGLAIDDCQGRCRVLAFQFSHRGIECMMDPSERTGAMQLDKVVMRRAFGRKVLGQPSPILGGKSKGDDNNSRACRASTAQGNTQLSM